MQYALLIYGRPAASRRTAGTIDDAIAAILARPCVTGWARLHEDGSATTVHGGGDQMLVTDGPFIDSKEYLAGLIMIEAENLDRALEITRELQDARGSGDGGIEVRPMIEGLFRAA